MGAPWAAAYLLYWAPWWPRLPGGHGSPRPLSLGEAAVGALSAQPWALSGSVLCLSFYRFGQVESLKSVASWDPEQHNGQSLPPVPVVALGFVQCMGHLPVDRAVWPPRGWGGGVAGKPGCRGGREATPSRVAFWLGWGPVVRRRVRGSEMQ